MAATVKSLAMGTLRMLPQPKIVAWTIACANQWIAYVFLLWDIAKDAFGALDTGRLLDSAIDHMWMAVGLALRPFYRTPGFFERRCVARAMKLDPPPFRIEVRHVKTASVNDGKDVLAATLWLPKDQPGPFPTLIQRSPYGAQSTMSEWGQMLLAERGYAVLFQDTRGRFGSDGDFVPVEHEKADGAATVRWARAQPWCDGRIGVIGASYLGFAAWAAVGACEPGELQCVVPTITQAVVRPAVFSSGGAVALELLVLWFYLIEMIALTGPIGFLRACYRDISSRRLSRAFMHAPLATLDNLLVGKEWEFFQGGVREPHDDDGPFWRERSTLCELRPSHPDCVTPPPVHIVTGLHDFFVGQALIDFQRASALQPSARLTVAPWSHWDFVSLAGWQLITHATLHWLHEHMPLQPPPAPAAAAAAEPASEAAAAEAALARPPPPPPPPGPWETNTPGRTADDLAKPVQVCFLGSHRWRGFATWPPPSPRTLRLWLTRSGGLGTFQPTAGPTAGSGEGACHLGYVYRPSDPTPSAGGPSFNPFNAGGWSQRAIESRDDVLCFTSDALAAPICLGGTAEVRVRVSASRRSVDIVARLCRVDWRGASFNLCEGLLRLDAAPEEPCVGGGVVGGGVVGGGVVGAKGGATADGKAGATANDSSCSSAPGRLVCVQMAPLAVELAVGERLRLHVCSAAHPRWMRNLCADPRVPLHEQMPPPNAAGEDDACRVCVAVDDAACYLSLPIVEEGVVEG